MKRKLKHIRYVLGPNVQVSLYRKLAYILGFRPKRGLFFSPSLSIVYAFYDNPIKWYRERDLDGW